MKIVSIIGLIVGLGGLIAGVYCQMEIVPVYNGFDEAALTDLDMAIWRTYGDQKFLLGSIALFAGVFAIVLGLIAGIKKQILGWVALAVGLVSAIFGIMQSTHMFD